MPMPRRAIEPGSGTTPLVTPLTFTVLETELEDPENVKPLNVIGGRVAVVKVHVSPVAVIAGSKVTVTVFAEVSEMPVMVRPAAAVTVGGVKIGSTPGV